MITIFNWVKVNLIASKVDILLTLVGGYFIYLITFSSIDVI